jgi:hypothetical protein
MTCSSASASRQSPSPVPDSLAPKEGIIDFEVESPVPKIVPKIPVVFCFMKAVSFCLSAILIYRTRKMAVWSAISGWGERNDFVMSSRQAIP